MSDDLSSESNASFSKNEHRSLDFKLLLDEVKSGQQVRKNTEYSTEKRGESYF